MTARLVDIQDGQFSKMLEAFVTQPARAIEASDLSASSAQAATELAARLDDVAAKADIQSVRSDLDSIKDRLNTIARASSAAARLSTPLNRQESSRVLGVGAGSIFIDGLSDTASPISISHDEASLIKKISDVNTITGGPAYVTALKMEWKPTQYKEIEMVIEGLKGLKGRGLIAEYTSEQNGSNYVLTTNGLEILAALLSSPQRFV